MADFKTFSVQKRTLGTKGEMSALRGKNMVPGIYYDASGLNIPVAAPALPLDKLTEEMGKTAVFNLEIDDNGTKTVHPTLLWVVQRHPYKRLVTHVDYYGVNLDKTVKISVPLEIMGIAKGIKQGGKLEIYRDELLLICKPAMMPQKITVDVTNMELGKTMFIEDIKLPEGVVAMAEKHLAILAVLTPKGTDELDGAEGKAAAPAEEGKAAEPAKK